MKTVAIIGTFDSKGQEYQYLKEQIEALGCRTLTVDMGAFDPYFTPDVSSAEVAKAGGVPLEEIVAKKDRALTTATMAKGMEILLPQLYAQGKLDGVIALGGTGGSSMAAPAMRALPIGVPKVLVSTVASGDTSPYVGTSDLMMMPSIVDVAGLNSISTTIFRNAASAIVGMVTLPAQLKADTAEKKPLVAATMFGVTTPCVTAAQAYLEEQGYEVLVFHATGTGGKTMEALAKGGFLEGVLDLTTTEWCDQLFGGILAAGDARCEAAALAGLPTVMSVGALDMVNFGAFETVPAHYAQRNLYRHNPTITLMRTTAEENTKLGEKLAEKINLSPKGKAVMMLPLGGVSMIDAEGGPFHGPEEDKALFDAVRKNLDQDKVELVEMTEHINDEAFALAAAKKLIELMKQG